MFVPEAVFSDETANFVNPPEPNPGDIIEITLRCAKDGADTVFLHATGLGIPMVKSDSNDVFDFYSVHLEINSIIKYCFAIEFSGEKHFYNKRGLSDEADENYFFTIVPGFKTPNWAKNAVMYQIFVDRFYNGDVTNDVKNSEYLYMGMLAKKVDDWAAPLQNMDICNFYGGDLAGVMQKMEYLADLGVEVIYFNPLFVSPSTHKYDIQDYDYIDPHFGVIVNDGGETLSFDGLDNRYATMYVQRTTDKQNLEASNELMIKLIQLAHKNGIKVILDGVFNHCGAFNKWMDTEGFYGDGYEVGAYHSQSSPYVDYFLWREDGKWPKNKHYDAWWGHDNHPKLNFEGSRELYDEILRVAAKWVSPPFNADGWRLDVAADLGLSREFNIKFWADFRDAVKKANPEAIIIAEHYGDPSDWLDGRGWDSVMNYDAFMEPVSWFFTGMQKHSEAFSRDALCDAAALEGAMLHWMAKMPYPAAHTAMNQLSNHDHSRFLTRTNGRVGRLHTIGAAAADAGVRKAIMLAAVAMQFTWPGCPTVYYGDEAGLCGWTDPDNRRPYPWGNEDKILLEFHKKIINIHKQYTALRGGSLVFLLTDYGVLSYGRWDAYQSAVCVFNNNAQCADIEIPVWRANVALNGQMEMIIMTRDGDFSVETKAFVVDDGMMCVHMPPFSSAIWVAS
ncbi:MAG: glycoside hydrolase family 13 protein [Defluviitaleaceae bacterium]|nr:glycoside hydrolase family 13 protein [Defluviitaleaceae bacterium]